MGARKTPGRAVVLHERFPPDARPDELDALVQAATFEAVLVEDGWETSRLALDLDLEAGRRALDALRPALVVNLVEALGGTGRLLHLAPALLDVLGIPYTGGPTWSLLVTTDKVLTKRVLRAAGLPTPDALTCADLAAGGQVRPGRHILKPVAEDASVGLDDDSVVDLTGREDLARLLSERAARYRTEVFAEAFVEGREFNLSVLEGPGGPEVLPVAEMRFVDYAPGKPRIVGYTAKWAEGSFEATHTVRSFGLERTEPPLARALADLARRAWTACGVRGYARVDFRVDPAGRPWILELNVNPCIAPDAGFTAAAAEAGLDGRAVVRRIVAAALS